MVSDEIWNSLTFSFMKKSREYTEVVSTYEATLFDLLTQIQDLSELRTGSSTETIHVAKLIASVREESVFASICENPPVDYQDLVAVLRSRALEADRA